MMDVGLYRTSSIGESTSFNQQGLQRVSSEASARSFEFNTPGISLMPRRDSRSASLTDEALFSDPNAKGSVYSSSHPRQSTFH